MAQTAHPKPTLEQQFELDQSRAATHGQRRGRSPATELILAGQSAHARRRPTLCEAGPLSALRRKRSGKMDSVTYTIFDQRALESRRLSDNYTAILSHRREWSDHEKCRDDERGGKPTPKKRDKKCPVRGLPAMVHPAASNGPVL